MGISNSLEPQQKSEREGKNTEVIMEEKGKHLNEGD
jgi:hypothetical protein